MRFRIIVVGKIRHPALLAATADYETRAARYWPLEVSEVREEGGAGRDAGHVREREASRLLERAAGAMLVACDERGVMMDSVRFSTWMQGLREAGRDVAFVIGGAHGLAPDLRSRAEAILSLAPWTLPHEMARLVLAEQLYRAGTLVRREPYHK